MAYDVVVIGSGPGGYSAAVRAGQYGLKTALIERQVRLGGTCLLVGCIPTKSLLHSADVWEYFQHPEAQGVECKDVRLNYGRILDKKNKIVLKHSKGIEFLMRKNKVDVIKGNARLLGGGRIEVTSDQGTQTVETKNIILATGSEARMLPGLEPDNNLILTNIQILDMTEIPPTLGIIGAGAVGVEFASIFSRFGSKVTVLEMLPRVVPVEDEEISKELEKSFKKAGIRVETGARAENITRNANSVSLDVTLASGQVEKMEFSKLLVAVGRKPNTGKVRFGKHRRAIGSRLCEGERISGDQRAGPVCHWRYCGRHSAIGACSHGGRDDCGRPHRRQERSSRSTRTAFPARPIPIRHRQRRPDGSASPRARLRRESRQVSVRGQ